ncbi:hypothetical protein [Rhodoflexus sp.]
MASQRRLQGQKNRWLIALRFLSAVVVITLGAIGVLQGQPSAAKIASFEAAMKAYKAKKYADAVFLLESMLTERKQDEQALYYAALCYLQLQQAGTAYDYLKLISKEQAVFIEDYHYWLGRAAYMNHRFEESKIATNTYLTQRGSKRFAKDAATILTMLGYVDELMRKPVTYAIENIQGINSVINESIPISFPSGQRLWFIRKSKGNANKTIAEREGWFLVQKQDGEWRKVSESNQEKNDLIILQWVDSEQAMLALGGGKLWLAQLTANNWQIVRELKIQFIEASRPLAATLYDQSRKLIFSAFNPESGSLDLFYTELKADGSWSFPFPIVEINSTRDEFAPFFAADSKTLYFSSKGWNSIGGFDIFKTQYDPVKKHWSTPENVGFPINSTGDDYWLQIYGNKGFLASNRSGGMGGDDIYQFFPIVKVLLTGKITGKRGEPLANTQIQFTHPGKTAQLRTDVNGNYKIEIPVETDIQLCVWQQGKIQYQENFRITAEESNGKTVQRSFSLQAEKTIAQSSEQITENISDAQDVIFVINGIVKSAERNQPVRATIKLIDINTARTVKFTSTDANGRFNFYLDKPIDAYFIEVTARGFFSHWQLGEQIGKGEYSILLQPMSNETNWQIPSIVFDNQTDKLSESSRPVLDRISSFLLENGTLRMQIKCPEGSARLGEKRAATVMAYLAQKGVSPERMIAGNPIPNSATRDRGIELQMLP